MGERLGSLWVRRMGEGPTLVAIHGGPGLDHTSLLPLARRLSGSFEVWLPDLPGHGNSRLPSGRAPGLRELQRRLAAWLQLHVPQPDLLLGHSLGAWLIRELVRTRSEGTKALKPGALALLAPPVAGRDPAMDGQRSAVRRAVRDLPRFGTTDALGEILAHVRRECGGEVPEELANDLKTGRLESAAAYGGLLRNLHRRLTGPLRAFAPPCKALVLCGEADATTPADVAARLGTMGQTEVEILPHLGHYLYAQAPDVVAERLIRFWSKASQAN